MSEIEGDGNRVVEAEPIVVVRLVMCDDKKEVSIRMLDEDVEDGTAGRIDDDGAFVAFSKRENI